jgi:N-acetylmuramoyl-L-alanine amidase
VALELAELQLSRGEASPETLTHRSCAVHLGRDLALIPLVERSEAYPTLDLVARNFRKRDRVYLAGFANGYSSLDTESEGPVSQLDIPPDELAVAHLTTSPGMSGGPLLASDGKVVGMHRGGIKFVSGYSHITRVEKVKILLEPMLGTVLTDIAARPEPPDTAVQEARSSQLGALVALQSLPTSERLGAWKTLQAGGDTSSERAFLERLPPDTREKTWTGGPIPDLSATKDINAVAAFIQRERAQAHLSCVRSPSLTEGHLSCEGRSMFIEGGKSGAAINPDLIVLHYAAAISLSGVTRFLIESGRNVSVHFLIDRDGTVVQLVPTNKAAGHAGRGTWRGDSRLNSRSIGIEFINAGSLSKGEDGKFRALGSIPIPENQVIAVKQGEGVQYWHRYTAPQIEAAEAISREILKRYPIKEIIGHCNISESKIDPGPAFPQVAFGEAVIGRGVAPCDRTGGANAAVASGTGGMP